MWLNQLVQILFIVEMSEHQQQLFPRMDAIKYCRPFGISDH